MTGTPGGDSDSSASASGASAAPATPWARRRTVAAPRATGRLRRTAEGLPDWDPLPPGEARRPRED